MWPDPQETSFFVQCNSKNDVGDITIVDSPSR